jgi:hypothetical protein
MFGRLKDWRRIATRYDRCAHTFLAAIALAATITFWLNQSVLSLGPAGSRHLPAANSDRLSRDWLVAAQARRAAHAGRGLRALPGVAVDAAPPLRRCVTAAVADQMGLMDRGELAASGRPDALDPAELRRLLTV